MFNRKLVFSAACIGMLLFGIVLISLGSILPSVTEKFALDELNVGALTSILPFGILAGSIVFGPIVDRYGYKNLLIICSALVLLGLEGIAFADSLLLLQVSIFLIGFGGGVLNGGTNALVSDISTEEKGANLSLLGVFFGIGALGMPLVLGILSEYFSNRSIISGIGYFILLPLIFFLFIKFPMPKQPQGFPIKKSLGLFKDSTLVLLGFILFFESGIEGIVNNWTTTYLIDVVNISHRNSLYALSYFVAGMTVTRLILGFVLKKIPSHLVFLGCISIAFIGTLVMISASSYSISVIGLILLGIGFAAGFPVILGYVGNIYSNLSGTAFSIVLVIALIGNMIINYLVGIIANSFGVEYFTFLILISLAIMAALLLISLKRISEKK